MIMVTQKKKYTAPFYLVDGKRGNHTDMIAVARQCGLPINIRKMSIMEFAQYIYDNPDIFSANTHNRATQFLKRVQGPFKNEEI